MKRRWIAGLFLLGMIAAAPAREWTSSDGKKLEADFVSLTGDQLTLKRKNGQTFSLPLDRLSEADQSFAKLQTPVEPGAPAAPAVKAIEGPLAKLVTGAWELSENDGLKFAFYGGKQLDAAAKYPLVLSLHGKSPNAEKSAKTSPSQSQTARRLR